MTIKEINTADYMAVTKLQHDGCQWNPHEQRGSLPSDDHWQAREAEVIVGGSIKFRLCKSCANLPRWAGHKHAPVVFLMYR